MYQIREKKTGLYQKSGGDIHFNKIGKAWAGTGHVKNHLAMIAECMRYKSIPRSIVTEWEIVEYTVETGILRTYEILDFYPTMFSKYK